MPTLRQIRSFIAVCEEASFTAAAARERATQSGISQHIKKLEAELGIALFERDRGDVRLTTAGRLYYAQCVDVLKRLDAAQQACEDGAAVMPQILEASEERRPID